MGSAFLFGILGVALACAIYVYRSQLGRRDQRRRFIAGYRFPQRLREALAGRHPEWSDRQRELVLAALRQYLLACLDGRIHGIASQVAMPSKAVDEAWREFIRLARDYKAFCERAFGEYLSHAPRQPMDESLPDALANTLHLVRQPPPQGAAVVAAVPLLFAIDRELGLAGGYLYDAKEIEVVEARRQLLLAPRDWGDGDAPSGTGCGGGDSGS